MSEIGEMRYTVEQVYLINQMLRSGMSKEEILLLYDRIKREMEEEETSNPASNPEPMMAQSVASATEILSSTPLKALMPPPSDADNKVNEAPATSTELMSTRKLPVINYEETAALQLFKSKGDVASLKDIKKFVSTYNISQMTIAEMIRVSQGYVSRFMNGDFDQVSDRVKNLIYLWYIECRSNPKILQQCLGSRAVVSENGVLMPIKRDKFKFQQCHLSILERFFKETEYPNKDVKKLIAETCNYTYKKALSRDLMETEKVTVTLVNTWFNNRRKESKPSTSMHL